jgi:hypothetical protein
MSKQLACEKHHRILIGKDKCLDCKPKQSLSTSKQITKEDIDLVLLELYGRAFSEGQLGQASSKGTEKAVNQLLSLISEHENYIIGEDEDHKGDRWERGRNELREEQRKRKLSK